MSNQKGIAKSIYFRPDVLEKLEQLANNNDRSLSKQIDIVFRPIFIDKRVQ